MSNPPESPDRLRVRSKCVEINKERFPKTKSVGCDFTTVLESIDNALSTSNIPFVREQESTQQQSESKAPTSVLSDQTNMPRAVSKRSRRSSADNNSSIAKTRFARQVTQKVLVERILPLMASFLLRLPYYFVEQFLQRLSFESQKT